MSSHDSMHERGRALEEEYFRRREQELIEKLKATSAAARDKETLAARTGVSDPAVIAQIQELGFTAETLPLLPFVPIIEVAWADAGVTPDERRQILALAEARGITEGSPAHGLLLAWLDERPSAEVFAKARSLVNAVLAVQGQTASSLSASELVAYAEKVAMASGGVFGIGSVSGAERHMLKDLAEAFGRRR